MPAPLRILVVEDDPVAARLVRERIAAAAPGAGIQHAGTLAEAARELRAAQPDVLVLDLGLPDSGGLDTLRAIRPLCGRCAILVLTGNDDAQLGPQAAAEGAHEYLVKSELSHATLQRALHQAVERKRAQDAALAERVDRDLVRDLLQDVVARASLRPPDLMEVGERLAARLGSAGVETATAAYVRAGLARELRAETVEGRTTFRAQGNFEVRPKGGAPTCYLALGFLSGVVSRASGGRRSPGAETTCQSKGDDCCTFVVQAR